MGKQYLIVAVVEGHGDATAVPAMVRNWLKLRRFTNFLVKEPAVRAAGASALKVGADARSGLGIEHYVTLALAAEPDAILVVLDADEECLERQGGRQLGPELLARAEAVAGSVPVGVVVANREFEAWFLADYAAFKRQGLFVSQEFVITSDIEYLPGCKGKVARLLGQKYEETLHQRKLAAAMSFSRGAMRHSSSYQKLLRTLEYLICRARGRPCKRCSTRHKE